MIRKTERLLRRKRRVWERGYIRDDERIEDVKRETWWLLWLVPLYSRDTIVGKSE